MILCGIVQAAAHEIVRALQVVSGEVSQTDREVTSTQQD